MTPEQGYELAKFQRPGVKIVMGPTDAVEVEVTPMSFLDLRDLPGDANWFDRDMRAWLGFVPSLWATFFATVAGALGHFVTKEEWEWLDGRNSSLDKARKWINDITESKEDTDNDE